MYTDAQVMTMTGFCANKPRVYWKYHYAENAINVSNILHILPWQHSALWSPTCYPCDLEADKEQGLTTTAQHQDRESNHVSLDQEKIEIQNLK